MQTTQGNYSLLALFLALLLAQGLFWHGVRIPTYGNTTLELWHGTRNILPNLAVVPPVPSEAIIKAKSLGDDEFYFRIAGLTIQNAGDTFGRNTALRDYNYSQLYQWWIILDRLNNVSDYIPTMVSYYYGASQEPKRDVPYVVRYLEEHADKNPAKKWWWYGQAVYHAKNRLNDIDWALRIADKMTKIPAEVDIPIWIRQMKAFILEDKGEYNEACEIILNILDSYHNLSEGEIRFMMNFIQERLGAMLKADEVANGKADIDPRCRAMMEVEKNKALEVEKTD